VRQRSDHRARPAWDRPSGLRDVDEPSATRRRGDDHACAGACNLVAGDCCSPTCGREAAGSPCGGDPCTINQCDGAGTCVGTPPSSCRAPGKALLRLQNAADHRRDRLRFKWLKGAAVAAVELGDPLQTADYTHCVYAGPSSTRLASLTVPAGAAGWSALASGYRYNDPVAGAAGVRRVRLKPGAAGRAKAQLSAKGANLPDPTFSNLALPVRVRLVNDQTATCFEAIFTAAEVRENDAGLFKGVLK